MLHVAVAATIRADRLDQFLALIAVHASGSRAEPGCVRFEVLRQPSTPGRFLLHEVWLNHDALMTHRLTPHYARWRREISELLAEPRTHEEYIEVCREDEPAAIVLARAFADGARLRGQRIAMTNGCFDLLGPQHLHLLKQARAAGDVLFVAVNDDASIRRLKGSGRPIVAQGHRLALLNGLACVDGAVLFSTEGDLAALVEAVRPAVLVKGEDWRGWCLTGQEYADRIMFVPLMEGHSTTATIHRLATYRDG
jgi:rfaE bifunctional protein nucleotidyltransferase chain/domain